MKQQKPYKDMSEEEKYAFDDRILRNHNVNLERVQRIHQEIDNEPMEFSADSIASMLDDIAERSDMNDAFTLHAVSRALRGLDEHHVLILKQKKRGKFVSPTDEEGEFSRNLSWLHTLALHERNGVKTEAAIAFIAERWSVSRASVFAGIKEAEDYLALGRSIDWPSNKAGDSFINPRPSKTKNA